MLCAMKLGEWLAATGTARSEFAERIGVDHVSVTRYVNGVRMPRKATLAIIREVTNGKVTADDFVAVQENSLNGDDSNTSGTAAVAE